jgi:protein-disulfide isomerase
MKVLVVLFLIFLSSVGQTEISKEQLRTYGVDNDTIIYVFTSFSCPYCAAYHQDILPVLKKRYTDTGKARIKIVDLPNNKRSLTATLMARCMSDEEYETFTTLVYKNQGDWLSIPDYHQKLRDYATQAGLSEENRQKCTADVSLMKTVEKQGRNLSAVHQVQAMPTTVVVHRGNKKGWVGADPVQLSEIADFLGE